MSLAFVDHNQRSFVFVPIDWVEEEDKDIFNIKEKQIVGKL